MAGPIVERAASAIPWAALWTIVIVAGSLWLIAKKAMPRAVRRILDAVMAPSAAGRNAKPR